MAFAIPLFWGNLFQQLYNTADSVIVGNFLGNNALAAVSSSGNLIFLLVGFFNGIAIGAGVVTGRYFGAGDKGNLGRSVYTTVSFGLVCGVILTAVGIVAAPRILVLMGTPAEVLPESLAYFRVYFAGSLAFVMYNFFVGILQAMGDSRHPLIFLVISSVTNIVLDLLFCGSAWNGRVVCGVCDHHLPVPERLPLPVPADERERRFPAGDREDLGRTGRCCARSSGTACLPGYRTPSSRWQMCSCSPTSTSSGLPLWRAAAPTPRSRVRLPAHHLFALALTTFISQNLGAREYGRAKKGAVFGAVCSLTVAELTGLVINLLAPVLIGAFGGGEEAVAYGVQWGRTVTWFYFLLAFSHCMAGVLRGAGRSVVPMLVMMVCWCVIRVSYISIAVRILPDIRVIYWAYPMTWLLSSAVFLLYFLKSDWIHGLERKQ